MDQMSSLDKMKKGDKGFNSDDPQENNQVIAELNKKIEILTYQLRRAEGQSTNSNMALEKQAYNEFNRDIKGRLRFVNKLLDFQKLADEVAGKNPKKKELNFFQKIGKSIIQDGELASEHFAATKSELSNLMEAAYFPVIDCQEHEDLYSRDDDAIKREHEKLHDTLLVELMTIQHMLHQLGQYDTPKGSERNNTMSEQQRMVIGGLMKRILNQIPAKIPGKKERSDDF